MNGTASAGCWRGRFGVALLLIVTGAGLISGEGLLSGGELKIPWLSSGVDRSTGEQHNEWHPNSDQSRFTGEQRIKRVSPNIRGVLINQLSTLFCVFR